MSSVDTSPPPEPEQSWKQRYQELEAQMTVTRNLDPTAETAKAAQIKKGRFFRRMVDMFAVPADLITENHRRLEAEVSDEVLSSTTEEDRLFRSYKILIQHVPLVESLDE
ncbi:hypothetical protein FIBSPDRAFT_891147 [Athelia psychrophila]|uniref:Uncharacterized protein n=1 Tax=Athelia psychrophila TaxID=1759441 RepID=A0A166K227_9AGAM|nr:hypothetical protein FIBSPDRAFT_891147 [Fibularhizoctonia sp. CBS 109695]